MFDRYLNFIRKVSVNRLGKLGVILTTSSFVTFLILELASLTGLQSNAYVGLITYLFFPAVFVLGLILIPIGWYRRRKQTGLTSAELLKSNFGEDQVRGRLTGSRLFMTIVSLSLVNIVFLGMVTAQMLHFMDQPRFCGTACHKVMHPEWVTYQASPHARVKCVECHVGEGTEAVLDSKLNGLWQIVSSTFDLYERPIPTPVRQLRPARETCEKCHWPEKFYGSRLKQITRYQSDSASTPLYTSLALRVDAGPSTGDAGIHWHVAQENEIRYASVRDNREEMIWVEVRQKDGSYKRYNNQALEIDDSLQITARVMDCVDCHNRATHIYEYPGDAVDDRISRDKISLSLPYIRREAYAVLTAEYTDSTTALQSITDHIHTFYEDNYPDLATLLKDSIEATIGEIQSIYLRNIHPGMKVTWGSYPNHLGHENSPGCFRCHDSSLEAEDGSTVSDDCELCHALLKYEEDEPLITNSASHSSAVLMASH